MLRIILTLSFIGSSFFMFTGLQDAFSTPSQERIDSFKKIFENVKDETPESQQMIEDSFVFMESINLNIVNYGVARFMLNAISVIGVYLMYRKRKIGFMVYSGVQSLMLGLPILFGGYSSFSLGVTFVFGFITMVFIVLYASQLKYLE